MFWVRLNAFHPPSSPTPAHPPSTAHHFLHWLGRMQENELCFPVNSIVCLFRFSHSPLLLFHFSHAQRGAFRLTAGIMTNGVLRVIIDGLYCWLVVVLVQPSVAIQHRYMHMALERRWSNHSPAIRNH